VLLLSKPLSACNRLANNAARPSVPSSPVDESQPAAPEPEVPAPAELELALLEMGKVLE
jgi:hypothetical protein